MKKTLYIGCTLVVLFLCGSCIYYFIMYNQRHQDSYIQQKNEACLEEFHQYYNQNNYNNSNNDLMFGAGDDYGRSNIKYSPKTNSCIQYFEKHYRFWYMDRCEDEYTIIDETRKNSLYNCIITSCYSPGNNCKENYEKKLKKLGLK